MIECSVIGCNEKAVVTGIMKDNSKKTYCGKHYAENIKDTFYFETIIYKEDD